MRDRGDLDLWWRLALPVAGLLARACFRFRVRGAEHVPASGPAVIAANHVSALDGVVVALVIAERRRRTTRFLAGAEFFRSRSVGWALRRFGQIPLRRGEGDRDALDEAIRTLRAGALVGLFPEGRVNARPDAGLQPARSGVARVALSGPAPVVPVGMWGTNLRDPRSGFHLRRPWRPTVGVVFGDPIALEGDADSPDDARSAAELVVRRIASMVEEARAL